jgi:hypothetical protein
MLIQPPLLACQPISEISFPLYCLPDAWTRFYFFDNQSTTADRKGQKEWTAEYSGFRKLYGKTMRDNVVISPDPIDLETQLVVENVSFSSVYLGDSR